MQQRPLSRLQPYPARTALVTPSRPGLVPYEPAKDFTESLRTIWRNRKIVFTCSAAFAVGSVLLALILPSTYAADARIEVGTREPHLFSSDQQLPATGPDAAKVESARIGAQSRDVASRVVDKLHLDNDPEFDAGIGPIAATGKTPEAIADAESRRNRL